MKYYEIVARWLAKDIKADALGVEIRKRLEREGVVLQVEITQIGEQFEMPPKQLRIIDGPSA